MGEPLEVRLALSITSPAETDDPLATPLVLDAVGEVTGRYLFYNDSAFDGKQAAANPLDDNAIAPDKLPLMPGGTARFENYSSYSQGINGLLLDIASLANPAALSTADFEFRLGTNQDFDHWQPAPEPTSITVRPGAGLDGSDRVTIVWPNAAIQKTWLQVTVRATPNTGLARSDVFYFGNLVGESGDSTKEAETNADDVSGARANPHTFFKPAAIDDAYDFNRDKLVNATDQLIAANNFGYLELITAPDDSAPEITLVATDLLELTVGYVEFLPVVPLTGDPPHALLHDVTLTFTDLPGDFGQVIITLDSIDGYDDNADGLIDGFALSTQIDLNDINLTVGERTLLTLESLTLGIDGLTIRPELDDGFQTGELIFSAGGLQLLPSGAPAPGLAAVPMALPALGDVGSIDVNTGAFSLSVDVPAAIAQRLTLSGWIPAQLTHVAAAFDPSSGVPDMAFALTGFVDADSLVTKLGTAIGSPNLALTVEAYDEANHSFAPTSAANPLTFGIAHVAGELRPTNTPPLKVSVSNIELPLGATLGDLTLGGSIAVGGFDGFGLPAPMPVELGPPYAGQQVVGHLDVTSTSGLGQITGAITLGGNFASSNGLGTLALAGQATLSADLAVAGILASGTLAAAFTWDLEVDTTTGEPNFAGLPTLTNIQATDLHLTVPELLTLDVGAITYADPETLTPGDPIATLDDATLTFTDLPGDFGIVAVSLNAIDGYDDNADGLIDGFALSTQIDLSDINLTVGERTLLTLESLTLGIDGLTIRPELDDGFLTGELIFSAGGLQLLPSGAPTPAPGLAAVPMALPALGDVGSIDVNTGAFSLSVDVPAAIAQRLTLSGWIPAQLTHVAADFDPSSGVPDMAFALTGFVDADSLVTKLGTAIGSPNLALTVEAYDEASESFAPTSAANPLTFGIAHVAGELRPTNTPPLKISVSNIELPLGATLGDLTLGGSIAVGGFDGFGLPAPMPAGLGPPYAGQQVVGSLDVTSTSGLGAITGAITLGGNFASSNGLGTLALAGEATLSGDLAVLGLSGSGTVTGQFAWPIAIDSTSGAPQFSGLPQLTGLQASDIVLEIEDVVRFDIRQIDYVASPEPGQPIATATGAAVTLLGIFASANLSSSSNLSLYDDDGDGLVDGVALEQLNLAFAAGQTWDYPSGGTPLLRIGDLGVTLSGIVYRPLAGGFATEGTIDLNLGTVSLYPDGGGEFTGSVNNATGSIDPATGEVTLHIGQLAVGLGPNELFQIDVADATFRLDDSDATDILTIASAELRVVDAAASLEQGRFGLSNFRFNVIGGQPLFGLGGVELEASQGVLGSLGLAGFLPLDVTDARLAFADDELGYTDFTDFTLSLDGFFDLELVESFLPFTPILSIGPTSAGDGANPHTFNDLEFGFDLVEGRITPLNLADIHVGFADWAIGELVFAGELLLPGYVNGVLIPTVGGTIGVDTASPRNRVQPSGTGLDFYGAQINLAGTIDRTPGLTSLVVDADAQVAFDLQLGDFLRMSDLGFQFGLDVTVADNFLADPLSLTSVVPRLDQMSVGSLTAGIGDFISLGAVPGSGGGPGLVVNFAPGPTDPLAVFNFNVQSPLVGLSGTVENLALLPGGVPDFDAIDQIDIQLISRGDGSPSLLQDFFAEFLPLDISRIALKFKDDFFAFAGPPGAEQIAGIANPTALNLITSGRAGTPSWLPEEFLFEVGSDFSNLEIDLAELVAGHFAIVNLGGLGFELGIDLGAFKIGGAAAVGVVDADPSPAGEAPIYYLAVEGGLQVGDYGATGALALTTAGPLGATLSVPLAIPLGQSGFMLTGAAGTIQFGTTVLPDPEDIQRPADLGDIPNPFNIDLSSVAAIEGIVQGLWVDDPGGGYVRPLWTEPVTVALQGEVTHVAVAGVLTGTATVAANITLPLGGATIDDAGLALLGFGDIRALGIPLADAKVVFDLRDELNPSFGFYFQAPSDGNPFGMLFPAAADFGVLLRTDGLAMATAIGLRSLVTDLAAGALEHGQPFFEAVAGRLLDVLQQDPGGSALADALLPHLAPGQSFADLDGAAFLGLVRDALEFDDVLTGLAAGQTVEQLAPALQQKLAGVIDLANALVQDLVVHSPAILAAALDDGLTAGEQLVALGLRNPGEENDPLDPLGLLSRLSTGNLGTERLIPVEFISEFTALLASVLGSAIGDALAQTAAFAASDSFNPRLLVEGAIQPTLLGVPVGEPPAGIQLSVSKHGVSYGVSASITRVLTLLAAPSPLNLLLYGTQSFSDETTIAYELPFDVTEALASLTTGGLPLGALNPFSTEWGMVALSQLNIAGITSSASLAQFGAGSTLLENNVQIVDDFDDPVDPGKIPVTSQQLLDRMLSLGGFLFTGGVAQSKLLADPFEVIAGILDAARQAGQELDDADGELAYLMQLFSTVPNFLEAVQNSLTEMEEFARVQAYLPVSYQTLLPEDLQDLLDGDPAAFNAAFRATFFDANGNIRDDAVEAVFQRIADELENSASTIAANAYFEGLLNNKLLGIELAGGRLFAGVLPDPENPGQPLDFGTSAVTVTGAIPWLGGLEIEGVLDIQELPLPAPPAGQADPLATLRAAFGDSVPLPRGRFELDLDTTAPPGQSSDLDRVLAALGLDPTLFRLPTVGQAAASVRAYTPGYDLSSSVPIERVGGLELLANLSIDGVVDNAEFNFRLSPPTGGYLPFTAKASVDSLSFGGFTITDAVLEITSDASGVRVAVQGETRVLGATFTVDGELDSQLRGELTLTLQAGQSLDGAFGGFSGGGSFTLVVDGPASASVAFDGNLIGVPGLGASKLAVSGDIESSGDFNLTGEATDVELAGFTINAATLRVERIGTAATVHVEGRAALSLLGAAFVASGELSTTGRGDIDLALDGGTPSFGGLSAAGTFTLELDSATKGAVAFAGRLSGVPGLGAGTLQFTGDIDSSGDFSLDSDLANLELAGFRINSASLRVVGKSGTATVYVEGGAELSLLGATFTARAELSTAGTGEVTLALDTGTPNFAGFSGSGTFTLELDSPASGTLTFDGTLSGLPGVDAGSLIVHGEIESNGDFEVAGVAPRITLAGFSIYSATLRVVHVGTATDIYVEGSGSIGLLGATFHASGRLSTTGSGEVALTLFSGLPSFGGFSGGGSFTLELDSVTSGSLTFEGHLLGVPGTGASVLFLAGEIDPNGDFDIVSSATNLTLAGFSISSAIVRVTRVGTTANVYLEGNGSINLLGATFHASARLETTGEGDVDLALFSGSPNFGGFSGSGTFTLELNSATSGSLTFDGSLNNLPGGFVGSLGVTGALFTNGTFTLGTTVEDLVITPPGSQPPHRVVLEDGSLSISGNGTSGTGQITGSGVLRVDAISWTFNGRNWVPTYTVAVPAFNFTNFSANASGLISATLSNFGFSGGPLAFSVQTASFQVNPAIGRFRLFLDNPSVSVTNFFSSGGTWTRSNIGDIVVDLTLDSADFEQRVWNGVSDLSLGGFVLEDTDVYIARAGGSLQLEFRSRPGFQAQVQLPANFGSLDLANFTVGTSGTFDVVLENVALGSSGLNVTANQIRLRRTSNSFSSLGVLVSTPTLHLPLNKTVSLPSFSFNADAVVSAISLNNLAESLLNFGSAFAPDSGQQNNMDFVLETTSSGWLFSLVDGKVVDLSLLPGTIIAELRSFQVDHNGNFSGTVYTALRFSIGANTYSFATATLNLTRVGSLVRLTIPSSSPLTCNLGFAAVPLWGYMASNGTYSFSGSSTNTWSVSAFNIPVARVVGQLAVTLSRSTSSTTFDATFTGSLQTPDGIGGWVTIATGSTDVNANGAGILGGVSFSF